MSTPDAPQHQSPPQHPQRATPHLPAKRREQFWLHALFACASKRPWVLRLMRPVVVFAAPLYAPRVHHAVQKNAVRLFGAPKPKLTRQVLTSFYDFIIELAAARHATADQLRSRISAAEGHDAFVALRQRGGGAVMVTAHMGSFEVSLAALAGVEKEIHVVFKRDGNDLFEQLRQSIRTTLGVHEAAIDDGWPTLINLRDRLQAGAVVVMQADRAMPGQKAQAAVFAHGHLRLPLGPVRLAQMTASPIVPVFTIREPDGRYRVELHPPIDPHADDAVQQLATVLAGVVTQHAGQWLVLEPAFVEDASS